ncbi:hypothetical protein D6201_05595 [Aurantiacibacter aquimixticola]|uniref:Uncharacterized protein n=2 Tax=Aurantiacibacter aquimixticola TaxID=1958945 RepID=A0A419RSZ9_9SPHN|nr:hypothetical protein D6201_05595 [Aurantiacibacter aquimixticola]
MRPGAVQARTLLAANDNPSGVTPLHVNAALRHFAQYGISAAEHARAQATKAARSGDRQGFEWWLGICRALDRRMPRAVELPDCGSAV